MVYNSNRPASITKEKKILTGDEKNAKFPAGPTLPKPGPMFPIRAREAVKPLNKSAPSAAATKAVIRVKRK